VSRFLGRNTYWVETVSGAFTLAIRTKPKEKIFEWNTLYREQLADIARDELSELVGYKVKKLNDS